MREAVSSVSGESDELVAAMMERDESRRIADYRTLLERIDRLTRGPQLPLAQALQATSEFQVHDEAATDTVAVAATPESGIEPAAPKPARGRPAPGRWRRGMVWAVPALGVALAILAWTQFGARDDASRHGDTPMAPSGWGRALYDGFAITEWRALEGVWKHGSDAEGGRVLSGRGVVARQLPQPNRPGSLPLESYRLSMLVDLQTASAVELHFAITPAGTGQAHYVLRVASDGVRLGQVEHNRATMKPISDAIRFPPPDQDAAVNYHELRVERRAAQWSAFFDGKPVGHAPAQPSTELPEIRIVAEGGTALFDAVELVELVPAAN